MSALAAGREPLAITALDPALDPVAAAPDLRREIRALAWDRLGLVRQGAGLESALRELAGLWSRLPPGASEARNLAIAGSLVAAAALHRVESRGAHFRSDFPLPSEAWRFRQFLAAEVTAAGVSVEFAPAPPGHAELLAAAIA